MSYKLYTVHWKIIENGKETEMFSVHKKEEDIGIFMREVGENDQKDLSIKHRPQGPGVLHKVSGTVLGRILSSNKSGLWFTPKDMGLDK